MATGRCQYVSSNRLSKELTANSDGGASISELQATVAKDTAQDTGQDSSSRIVVVVGAGIDLVAAVDAEVLAADVLSISDGEIVGSLSEGLLGSVAGSGGDSEGHGKGRDGGSGETHFER